MVEIPRIRFAHLPTPVEELPRLSRRLGGPKLLVKRDDQTGLAFGGNKTRKLEFLLGDALAQEADMLITAGAIQSNHCRQTAAAAARFGLGCELALFGEPEPNPSANLWLDQLLGAEVVPIQREERDEALKGLERAAIEKGRRPYLVPYGGSNSTGALGYAFAMQELVAQRTQSDWIVLPSSSGGTQAGMMAGAQISRYTGKILGISVDEPREILQSSVAQLATETANRLQPASEFAPQDALVNDDYCSPGYGVLTDAEREAVKMFAEFEGLLLDPVYTGRAAAGLLDLIGRGFFKKSETVLFWHTGGTPALFAGKYSESLLRRPDRG